MSEKLEQARRIAKIDADIDRFKTELHVAKADTSGTLKGAMIAANSELRQIVKETIIEYYREQISKQEKMLAEAIA